MSTNKQGKPVDVEALLAQAEAAQPAALKTAIANHAEAESKKQVARLQAQFGLASQYVADAVETLRERRKSEAKAKATLTAVAEGHAEFLKTGDVSALAKAASEGDSYTESRLKDQFRQAADRAEQALLNPHGSNSRY